MHRIKYDLPLFEDEKCNVFLDDIRTTPKDFHIRTYTYDQTIKVLKKFEGRIGILSLDNDLGENEKEGYHVMDWIEEQYYTKGYKLPEKIMVHSMNSVARTRMEKQIVRLYWRK